MELTELISNEFRMVRQKTKIAWLNEGDENTSFCHKFISGRKNKKIIATLQKKQETCLIPKMKSLRKSLASSISFFLNKLASSIYILKIRIQGLR